MPAPTFTIEYLDGTSTVVKLTPRSQIDYETETGRPITGLGADDSKVRDMYEMAWYAAGKPDTFDEWIDGLEGIAATPDEGEGDAALPT